MRCLDTLREDINRNFNINIFAAHATSRERRIKSRDFFTQHSHSEVCTGTHKKEKRALVLCCICLAHARPEKKKAQTRAHHLRDYHCGDSGHTSRFYLPHKHTHTQKKNCQSSFFCVTRKNIFFFRFWKGAKEKDE